MREMTSTAGLSAAFERDSSADRRSRSERAIQKALNAPQPVRWRHDGKPEVELPMFVSAAHSDGLTLAVAAPQFVACDLEPVQAREEQVWRDLLGLESWRVAQLIAEKTGEDLQTSATRVWTAVEALKKAGYREHGQIVVAPGCMEKQGCVSLAAAGAKIASTIVHFRENPIPVAITILTGGINAPL
jgi:enediyne polyketide synthase